MMGVLKDEIDEVLQNAKADHRIAGFDEEERRLRQRNIDGHYKSWKLPQGNYIFCDFRTLSIPGVEVSLHVSFFASAVIFLSCCGMMVNIIYV